MGKYGINVPKGVAVASTEEVKTALKDVFPSEKEVSIFGHTTKHLLYSTVL